MPSRDADRPRRHEPARCAIGRRGYSASRTSADSRRLRPQWNALLARARANNPFLTWEWLHAWWTHLRGNATLQMIAVWSDDELIAIAPLMSTRTPGWFSRLEFLGTGHAGSDYLDLIVRRGREAEALDSIG